MPSDNKKKRGKRTVDVRQPLRYVPEKTKSSTLGETIDQLNRIIADLKTNINIIETNLANVGHSAVRVVVDAMREGLHEVHKQLDGASQKKEHLLVKVLEMTQGVRAPAKKPLFSEVVQQVKQPQCNVLVQLDIEGDGKDCVEELKEKIKLPELSAGVPI